MGGLQRPVRELFRQLLARKDPGSFSSRANRQIFFSHVTELRNLLRVGAGQNAVLGNGRNGFVPLRVGRCLRRPASRDPKNGLRRILRRPLTFSQFPL